MQRRSSFEGSTLKEPVAEKKYAGGKGKVDPDLVGELSTLHKLSPFRGGIRALAEDNLPDPPRGAIWIFRQCSQRHHALYTRSVRKMPDNRDTSLGIHLGSVTAQ